MPMVRVYNKNSVTHKEVFKGDEIIIEPGKCIKMDFYDAIQFRGQFKSPIFNKGGVQTLESMKIVQIDPEDYKKALSELNQDGEERMSKSFVCFKCGKEFKSKKVLLTHVKNQHEEDIVDEDTRAELEEELEGVK